MSHLQFFFFWGGEGGGVGGGVGLGGGGGQGGCEQRIAVFVNEESKFLGKFKKITFFLGGGGVEGGGGGRVGGGGVRMDVNEELKFL